MWFVFGTLFNFLDVRGGYRSEKNLFRWHSNSSRFRVYIHETWTSSIELFWALHFSTYKKTPTRLCDPLCKELDPQKTSIVLRGFVQKSSFGPQKVILRGSSQCHVAAASFDPNETFSQRLRGVSYTRKPSNRVKTSTVFSRSTWAFPKDANASNVSSSNNFVV